MTARALQGRLVSTSLGEVHVVDEGPPEATPLLLVHGFAGSTHWWDRVAPALAASHRVVRLDLLGHGASPKDPPGGYDAPAQARMVAEVMDQLELSGVVAVGHSLGSHVVIALAELDAGTPSPRVRALVVVDQSPASAHATIPAANRIMVTRGLGAALHRHAPAPAVRMGLRLAFAPGFDDHGAFDDPDQGLRDVAALPHACFREMQLGLPRFVDQKPLDARLHDLGLPTLVIFGDQDQFHRADGSCKRYDAVETVQIERIPEAGHTPMIETPQRFTDVLDSFVERLATGT